jgi:hypothetical protein
MLGLVITMLVSASQAMPSAGVSCADGPASCDAALGAGTGADADRGVAGSDADVELPRRYATPAVIDCRAPVVPAVLQTLVGECDGGSSPRDAWYRVSRYPESEEAAGTVAPPRERGRDVASCRGLPPEGRDLLTTAAPGQPVALCAVPRLPAPASRLGTPAATFQIQSRDADPPDRPPRV